MITIDYVILARRAVSTGRPYLLCLILLAFFSKCHPPPFSAAKWLDLAERIDQDKAFSTIHLKNEEFLKDTSYRGELTGYFYNGNLRKMHCVIDYTLRIDEKTFYFDEDWVVFVRHASSAFAVDETTGEYRHDWLEAPFIGRYFFEGGRLLHYEVTEEAHHFESEEEDIEYSVSLESKLWIEALKRTAPK